MKVTKKIAEKIVLRDDATPYGGTSYHGETLANFMAVGGVRFGTSLKKVNEALVECGIMPITEQEVNEAMKPKYYCPECGEPLEQGQYYYDYESGETCVEHCHKCGSEGVLVVDAETHDYANQAKKAHDFSRGMNLPKSETFFKERDIYYKGEGVPLIGSGNKTGGGSPPAQPRLEVSLHEPSENPMTSVVGVRQEEKIKLYDKLCEEVGKYGYYALIEKGHRPKIAMIEEPSIRVKSLFMSNDESSPLKVIDENDTCWDGYDYFSFEELEKIFETSEFWK